MKRAVLLFVVLLSGVAVAVVRAPRSTAFAVTTSVTALTLTDPTSKSIRLDNNGSNSIWCRYQTPDETSTPSFVAGQGMKIAAGDWASFPAVPIWCIAQTGAQTGCSGSGTDCTWLTEVP